METNPRKYVAQMTLTSEEGADHFTMDVVHEPSLPQVLQEVGGNVEDLPPSYKMLLLMMEGTLGRAASLYGMEFDEVETTH